MKHIFLPKAAILPLFFIGSLSTAPSPQTAGPAPSLTDIILKEQKFYQKPITREYLSLAKRYQADEHYDQAIDCYKRVLEQEEHNFNALMNLAGIYFLQKDFPHAIDYYEQILTLFPRCSGAYYNLGLCYLHEKKYKQAQDAFESTVERDATHSKAWYSLGVALEAQDIGIKAVDAYKKSIALDDSFVYSYVKLGQLYRHLNELDKALSALEQAYQRDPDNVHIIMELANTLNIVDDNERALELYMRTLELDPTHACALYNFGFTLKKKDQIYEAIEIYKKALEIDPHYSLAHFSLGAALLTTGDFVRGWEEYEWRFAAYNEKQEKYHYSLWDGSSLVGKTIFIYAEQGLGDTIQFARYIPLLIKQGAKVIFQVQNQLKKFFQSSERFGTIIDQSENPVTADVQIPLMSLPYLFKTTLKTIPCDIPYLAANEHLISYWKSYMSHDDNFKVGICWHGNSRYPSHALQKLVEKKSIPLALLAPLSKIPGVSIYSLQKVDGCDQLKGLSADYTIHKFGPDFDVINGPFIDTAAVIKNLDLVISIDTSIAHLAGAMGVPTWVLLPRPADWRWLMHRNDSPWYPSVRLFRQTIIDDWSSVMSLVTHNLQTLATEKKVKKIQPKVELVDNQTSFDESVYFTVPEILGNSEHELLVNTLQRSLSCLTNKKD